MTWMIPKGTVHISIERKQLSDHFLSEVYISFDN